MSEPTPEMLAQPMFEILTKLDKRAGLEVASNENVEVAAARSAPLEKLIAFNIGSDYDDGDDEDQAEGCFSFAKSPETLENPREINAVSKAVSKEVNTFSNKYGLDAGVRGKLMASSDGATTKVVRRELSNRVRNHNGYVTKMLKVAEQEVEEEQHHEGYEGDAGVDGADGYAGAGADEGAERYDGDEGYEGGGSHECAERYDGDEGYEGAGSHECAERYDGAEDHEGAGSYEGAECYDGVEGCEGTGADDQGQGWDQEDSAEQDEGWRDDGW